MTTNTETNLKLIPSTPVDTTETDALFEIAKELMGDVAREVLDEPGIREMLTQLLEKRLADKAERDAEEQKKIIADQAEILRKKANALIHPIGKPKEKAVLIHKDELASLLPENSNVKFEKIEQYRSKVPHEVFDSKVHAMAFRGFYLGVKKSFDKDAHVARGKGDEELAVACMNKAASIQRLVDIVTEILDVAHGLKGEALKDPKNHAPKRIFDEMQSVVYADQRLASFCSMPETKEQRLAREKQAEERKQAEEAKKIAELAEREVMIVAIINKMMTVAHFQKMHPDAVRRIAERITRKFSGSTPESRLKQASREKSGSEVKAENRQLGLALGMAAGFNTDELTALFPKAKQKKEKKQK